MTNEEALSTLSALIGALPPRSDSLTISSQHVARSLLQKALRRGDTRQAERAVLSLIATGNARWRALVTCAFEDFGASSPEGLAIIVVACASKSNRTRLGGDEAVARAIVQSLSPLPCDRRIDEIYMSSVSPLSSEDMNSALDCRRLQFDPQIVDRAHTIRMDSERPVPGQSFSTTVPKHADQHLLNMCQEGLISESERGMCVQARRTSQCLLPVIYPLAKSMLGQRKMKAEITGNSVPEVRCVSHIPGYAFDGFTREGRDALGLLRLQNPDLRCLLSGLDSKKAQLKALSALLFAVEGGVCTQEVSSSDYADLKSFALARWSALPSNILPEALATMRKAIPMLNDIREKVLR